MILGNQDGRLIFESVLASLKGNASISVWTKWLKNLSLTLNQKTYS
jgi:hypothetical protein